MKKKNKKIIDEEELGYLKLAELTAKEIWDNEYDEIWNSYIKKRSNKTKN